ncbi:bifunctional aldolase/short-chain dehydrogenase [Lysinibacter cavernae]|uniref:Rhamnose utilization protein RhaD (Predicted bifunctional aldolase and dehydrogenase)/NAD(P)-dependent dehydrogenase (Short-subunit alcohol dehydrogenase family) n=1 Tax=Lysinibacter cavernae TaxID=1640652 RepID=A0A7X5TSV0_9MICO|nr:bifunctional aldolase/short-chain dehydrogenase [Lysinibacter cavernae]NIH53916.1 rhamnose utilization protein RhaD (predicted bifunctional aldolase and dehydrogenase)/NAD(P)-dependent dehydrogenase (short-subunit alcohol dehydrogenase family) [Lysinibacter cavernae]
MKNLWRSAPSTISALDECVLGSQTIGAHEDLVLHGGGNSSIKDTVTDLTGKPVEVLYVKGSGWDMATIKPQGFAPLRMERLRELLMVDSITDSELVNELRCAMTNAKSPDPSIESPLHALLPYRAVLHSHADAIVSITNQPEPEKLVRELYGDSVVVIPYVMPGFELAKVCNELWPQQAHEGTVGMVLLNHGLFTFGETMEEAYSRHVELISAAEGFIAAGGTRPAADASGSVSTPSAVGVAELRKSLSEHAGRPLIVSHEAGEATMAFVTRPDLSDVARRGPATPDHIIRTKQLPLVATNASAKDVAAYVAEYTEYFERNRGRSADPVSLLDPTPRFILDSAHGMFTVGKTKKDANIVRDIATHTFGIINNANAVGNYTALSEGELFDVEYWELEQAKLRMGGAAPELTGQVALVTGAASGIGRACAEYLISLGASVVGIDISPSVATTFSGPQWLGLQADVCDKAALDAVITETALAFGGLDILVVAAGIFAQSSPISDLDSDVWDRTLAINVSSVQRLFAKAHPLLKLSPAGGKVAIIGSKNVAAPGPGAAAYSASKAALTQLGRVAALEWAPDGIRVNTVHPDAVFDTALWTPELLAERAAKYGVSIDEYKRRNLLSTEVTSLHVARMVGVMCGAVFSATTGAQVPVDGGNERVV